MTGFTEALINCVRETSLVTWLATVTAVFYVILALKENVWCWSFGIVSSALWVSTYFHQELWYEAILNIFYVVLGVYGWMQWAREKQTSPNSESKPELSISRIPPRTFFICISIAVGSGIILGLISSSITESRFAYSDALLSAFSVVTTWMTAKKYIENWLFWLVLNACFAILYFVSGPSMYLAGVLYIFYTFMSVGGYFAWKKNLKG